MSHDQWRHPGIYGLCHQCWNTRSWSICLDQGEYTRVYTRGDDTRGDDTRGDDTRGDDTRGDDTRGDDTRDDTSVLLVTGSIQCYQAHFESGRSSLNRIFCCCCCC
jgi:hypothetical protein